MHPADFSNQPFDILPRPRLVFAPGALARAGLLTRESGISRPLVVTDPGLVKAGHVSRLLTVLSQAGLQPSLFDQVAENPSTLDVDRAVHAARTAKADGLLALGGGSSLDTAKGCNFILTNGGRMEDYRGIDKATQPMLPFIAIPTTAGTGSECQSSALISDPVTHYKMACLDSKATARVAILDPELTLSLPPSITAFTGIDALTHALETAVTTRRTAHSLLFSREAGRLLLNHLESAITQPADLQARSAVLLAAAWAGTAIENSMLGVAHSCANPLTAHFKIAHGAAVGLMISAVIRFNRIDPVAESNYAAVARAANLSSAAPTSAVDTLLRRVNSLLDAAGISPSLEAAGIPWDRLPELAELASRQWTAAFNPRPVQPSDLLQIYQVAYQPR